MEPIFQEYPFTSVKSSSDRVKASDNQAYFPGFWLLGKK